MPVRKLQFEPNVIDVNPPPLGPDAVAVPENDADPVIATLGSARSWEKAGMMSKVETNKEILVRFIFDPGV